MNKFLKKDEKGMSLIEGVLLIVIIILISFLIYQAVVEDAFGIMAKLENNPINTSANLAENSNEIKEDNKTSISHNYYYEQLDDAGKILYKGLEGNLQNIKSGKYEIDFGTQFNDLLNSEGGEEKLNKAFQSAWNALTYDYVDIFYIDITKMILTTQTTSLGKFSRHKVRLSNENNTNYFEKGIESEEDLREKEVYIRRIRNKIISQLQGYSQYQQIKYLHNWMIENFEYDTTYKLDDIHNIYGAFANKKVVCEGYARAFKYVLDGLGIENVLVSGTATNSNGSTETHAWNYVKLNGKWYAVDVTWDDPIVKEGSVLTDSNKYQYFLKGSDNFLKNHKEDGYLSENSMEFKFPTLEKSDYK